MRDYPKSIKKLIREFSAEAHERELHRELVKLDRSFEEWRMGKIGSGELSYRVHEYETGPSRDLFKQYNYGEPDLNVAYAIVTGILKPDEVPPELLQALERALGFYQDLKDRTELRLPGE